MIPLIAYIHRNPVESGIVCEIGDYKYSSYKAYLGKRNEIIDTEFLLGLIDEEQYLQAHIKEQEDFVDYGFTTNKKKTEADVRKTIMECIGGIEPNQIKKRDNGERDKIIRQLRNVGLSIREIERETGISRGVIAIVNKRVDE